MRTRFLRRSCFFSRFRSLIPHPKGGTAWASQPGARMAFRSSPGPCRFQSSTSIRGYSLHARALGFFLNRKKMRSVGQQQALHETIDLFSRHLSKVGQCGYHTPVVIGIYARRC